MNDEQPSSSIVVDADVIFEYSHFLPVQLNEVFWRILEEALIDGKWILTDVVYKEIRFPEALVEWAKKIHDAGLVREVGDDCKNRAIEINNAHPMIDAITKKSETDTYILAYAEKHGHTIFSRETPSNQGARLLKIPNVCNILGITVIRKPEDFLNQIGYKN